MEFHWQTTADPLVREAGWSLFSAPILDQLPPEAPSHWQLVEDTGASEILALLEREPAPLRKHLAQQNDRRLGARFEGLWTYFLSAHPNYRLLAHNFVITRNGNTLGALDLLFVDHGLGAVVHAEIAVKFYLHYPPGAAGDLENWIGPNPDDSLERKIERLRSHQLPLSSTPEARRQLQRARLPAPDLKAVAIKGRLFHYWQQDAPAVPLVNPHAPRGTWLYARDLPLLLEQCPGTPWRLVDRNCWLTPDSGKPVGRRELASAIEALWGNRPYPVMLHGSNLLAPGDPSGQYFFVVPDQWPDA